MKTINYRSDFDAELRFFNCAGEQVSLARYNYTIRFFTTSKVNAYTIAHQNGSYTNAVAEDADGSLRAIFDGHGLAPGRLTGVLTVNMPDTAYPDGCRRVEVPFDTDMTLVNGASGCCGRTGAIDITLPFNTGQQSGPSSPGTPGGGDPEIDAEPMTPDEIDAIIDSVPLPE